MMNKNLKLFKGSHQNMWESAHNHVGCVHVLSLLLSQCRGCHYHTQTEMNGNSILANNATKGFTGQIVVICHWVVDWSGQVITRRSFQLVSLCFKKCDHAPQHTLFTRLCTVLWNARRSSSIKAEAQQEVLQWPKVQTSALLKCLRELCMNKLQWTEAKL